MSTVYDGYGCDRKWLLKGGESSVNFTKNVKGSWVGVSLPPGYSLVPTHYALRHGHDTGWGRLRHWELRGSSDGKEWEVLKKHNDDRSLPDEGFGIAHWPLDTTKAFSHFRVHQTGENSDGNVNNNHSLYNVLCCAGIELFGQLD
jgi:hypothetical protein